jgi:hypothetical protein
MGVFVALSSALGFVGLVFPLTAFACSTYCTYDSLPRIGARSSDFDLIISALNIDLHIK